ncbi:unnamed protein product, partial [Rotaria socialis]
MCHLMKYVKNHIATVLAKTSAMEILPSTPISVDCSHFHNDGGELCRQNMNPDNNPSQTTVVPNYYCYENDDVIQFTLSSLPHSAWQPTLSCSLQQCNESPTDNNTCRSSSTPCYDYRTHNNTSYCAPGILCSLLEPCNNITYTCASNNSASPLKLDVPAQNRFSSDQHLITVGTASTTTTSIASTTSTTSSATTIMPTTTTTAMPTATTTTTTTTAMPTATTTTTTTT